MQERIALTPISAVEICEISELTGELDYSFMVRIPANSKGLRIHFEAKHSGNFTDLAFNAQSFKLPVEELKSAGQACYAVDVGGEQIEVPIGRFDTVTIPYRQVEFFDIIVLTDCEDVLIVNDLRAVKDELPQDILQGFMGIKLPFIFVGTCRAETGDREVQISSVRDICEGSVLVFGKERHQVRGLEGLNVVFDDTEDGYEMLADYEGDVLLECPMRIGYYDQNVKLPSVVLWYSSPTPDLRAVRRESYYVYGKQAYVKKHTQFEQWDIRLDIIGDSPEVIQEMSSFVRRFLEENRVFVNGRKFTFEWTEASVDTEPSTYLEIQPSVAYVIKISVQEDFPWQTIQKGSGRLRYVIPTSETLPTNQEN